MERLPGAELTGAPPLPLSNRLNENRKDLPFTKAERRQRILAWLRLGWTYEKIAIEEGLSARRIRQIAADTVRREGLDDPTDHALLQLMRLESARAAAAEAVSAGDIEAIGPLLRVLERMDRYRQAGARKEVYDEAARKRLFAKLNRIAAQFAAIEKLARLNPRPVEANRRRKTRPNLRRARPKNPQSAPSH